MRQARQRLRAKRPLSPRVPPRARHPLIQDRRSYAVEPLRQSRLQRVRSRPTARRQFDQRNVRPATRVRALRPCARRSAPPDDRFRHRRVVHSVPPDDQFRHRQARVDPCRDRPVVLRAARDHDQWVHVPPRGHRAPVARHVPEDRAPVLEDHELVDPRRVRPLVRVAPGPAHAARVARAVRSVRQRVVVVVTWRSSSPPR